MDIFDEEILKFWAALQKCQVRYIANKKAVNRPKGL